MELLCILTSYHYKVCDFCTEYTEKKQKWGQLISSEEKRAVYIQGSIYHKKSYIMKDFCFFFLKLWESEIK